MLTQCIVTLQIVRRGRAAVREKEMDPLFRGRHRDYILCRDVGVRPGVARR